MTDKQTIEVKFDQAQIVALTKALNNLWKVLAVNGLRPELGTDKKARFLMAFGLKQSEVADLLGFTDQAIDQALTKEKKPRKSRKKDDSQQNSAGQS